MYSRFEQFDVQFNLGSFEDILIFHLSCNGTVKFLIEIDLPLKSDTDILTTFESIVVFDTYGLVFHDIKDTAVFGILIDGTSTCNVDKFKEIESFEIF